MVIMCAGCNVYQPWAAIVVGILGGFGFTLTHFLMLKFKLDDPLDAVAVHGMSGLLGVLCVPIFSYDSGIIFGASEAWDTLGVNALGAFAIIVWSAAWSTVIFYPLSKYGLYRIDRNTEFRGNDIIKHGEVAYPGESWVEIQVRYYFRFNRSPYITLNGDSSFQYSGGNTPKAPSTPGGTSIGSRPSIMSGTETSSASYNDAFQMVPTAGKLFAGFGKTVNSLSENQICP